jgi:hypothetical protein
MADQQDRPEPDHTEDPRKQQTGEGYPEVQPEGASPVEGTEQGPEAGTGGSDAPQSDDPAERDTEATTGNPNAAG